METKLSHSGIQTSISFLIILFKLHIINGAISKWTWWRKSLLTYYSDWLENQMGVLVPGIIIQHSSQYILLCRLALRTTVFVRIFCHKFKIVLRLCTVTVFVHTRTYSAVNIIFFLICIYILNKMKSFLHTVISRRYV